MPRPMIALALLLLALAGCVNAPEGDSNSGGSSGGSNPSSGAFTANESGTHTVNGSISVPAGQPSGEVTTVNGSIRIADGATLTEAHAVNGSIGVGAHATAVALQTVNGGISLSDGVHVARDVATVNGDLTLHGGSDVTGSIANVNGKIELNGAHVGGGIRTVNGDIDVVGGSHVEGGILVERPSMSWFQWSNSKPRVVIGPGSVVQGNLRFEREVKLYVSDKATIGPVTGATPVRFSGDSPPA